MLGSALHFSFNFFLKDGLVTKISLYLSTGVLAASGLNVLIG